MIFPEIVKQQTPLDAEDFRFISQVRAEIRHILNGTCSKLLVIVGPCSIHNVEAAKDYASKLKNLAQTVSDTMLILMRVHFEKPRTAMGWKGLMYDPHLNDTHDLPFGIQLTRKLLVDLTKMRVAVASEILTPIATNYFGDLISWGCIGARTAASPIHRQIASGLPMPVGIKNCPYGNVDIAVNGVLVASHPHHHIEFDSTSGVPHLVKTKGNPDAHIVLRGGAKTTNYDPESINKALKSLQKAGLPSRLLIDCSHGNSHRKHENQPTVFASVVHQILEGNKSIHGMLLESNLKEGSQSFANAYIDPEISITDSCLDFPTTEKLILWAHKRIEAYAS